MIITALNESPADRRVAITPQAVKLYLKLGLSVACEKDAGLAAGYSNKDYIAAGASILDDKDALLKQADILVCIGSVQLEWLSKLKPHALLIGQIDNEPGSDLFNRCEKTALSLFSMNLIPRISRAQSMDSLSSQANLAGYRAVLEGVTHFQRAVPMMMTAAGMIHPAKVLILGAGVAGLQAIATAKRLGAVVYAFDVRRAAKEQVESLGAEFIEVAQDGDMETAGGYAKEMTEEYKQQQSELIKRYAAESDIVITTALIPGQKAPVLLTQSMVEGMKPGSVIVDLATSRGGNCELSQKDKIIHHQHIIIIGISNLPGLIPATASDLYATNVVNLVKLMVTNPDILNFDMQDDIIKQALLIHQGQYLPGLQNKEKETVHA